MRLMLVEDDRLLGEAIEIGLTQAGFTVDWLADGESAHQCLRSGAEAYTALVLDLGLPGRDGLSILRALRQQGATTPVLILTARDAIEDRIQGLDAGADDYLLKPFAMGELAARLRALIRRAEGQASPVLVHGRLKLDPARHTVMLDEQAITLTAKEFALLHLLLLNLGRVLTRSQIEAQLYNWNDEAGSNTIEVYIHHLRKKLGNDLIHNVRGVGYLIRKP